MASVLIILQLLLESGDGILGVLKGILVDLDVAGIFGLGLCLSLRLGRCRSGLLLLGHIRLSRRGRLVGGRRRLLLLGGDRLGRVHIRIGRGRDIQGVHGHGTARSRRRDRDRPGAIGQRGSLHTVDGRVRIRQDRVKSKLCRTRRHHDIIVQVVIGEIRTHRRPLRRDPEAGKRVVVALPGIYCQLATDHQDHGKKQHRDPADCSPSAVHVSQSPINSLSAISCR